MSATLDSYLDRVTSEHADKPLFLATVAAIAQWSVDHQAVIASLPDKFDVDTAVGVQLDVVGQWVGLSRKLRLPIPNVYFSLDDAGVGFDLGIWFEVGDPTEGVISLDDETYRALIFAKIASNTWNGRMETITQIVQSIFTSSPGTLVFVQDNFDMSITIGIAGTIPSFLLQSLIAEGYIPFRPAAVKLDGVYITSVDTDPLFGFDVENEYISGFDVGAWGALIS